MAELQEIQGHVYNVRLAVLDRYNYLLDFIPQVEEWIRAHLHNLKTLKDALAKCDNKIKEMEKHIDDLKPFGLPAATARFIDMRKEWQAKKTEFTAKLEEYRPLIPVIREQELRVIALRQELNELAQQLNIPSQSNTPMISLVETLQESPRLRM